MTPDATDMDEIKDAIEEVVDNRHQQEGATSVRVGILQDVLSKLHDVNATRHEVQLACDDLVEEDRLVFLKDSGRAGRRYCSVEVDDRRIRQLQEDADVRD